MSKLLAAVAVLFALLEAAPAAAHPSRGIVVDRSGDIYFSDLVRIWRIRGDRLELVRDNRGSHTHGMIIDASGTVVWEESRYDPAGPTYLETVWRLNGGQPSRRFGPLRRPTLGLGIARDGAGCTCRANQVGVNGPPLVHRLCPGRRPQRLLGTTADEARYRPELINDAGGVAFGRDGSFLFRIGDTVRSADPSGRVRTIASGFARENFGIAADPAGALLVVEHGNRRVVRVTSGRRQVVATTPPGWGPTGVAVRGGSLLVLEASDYRAGAPIRMRVRQVGPRGRSRLLAQVTVPQG